MSVDKRHGNATVPPSILREYGQVIHDLNNSLAAANMKLELYQFAARSDGPSGDTDFADVARAMHELMMTCRTVADRLSAAMADASRSE